MHARCHVQHVKLIMCMKLMLQVVMLDVVRCGKVIYKGQADAIESGEPNNS